MNSFPALAAIALYALAASAGAASFTYRGHLEDSGQPAEGSYAFRLSLYADREGRHTLADPIEMTGVAVHRGSFAVGLDFPDAPAHASSGWLRVEVKSPEDGAWWPLPDKQPVALKAQICPESWALAGNADSNPQSNFLGTTDSSALEFRVNNSRALRIEPDAVSPNFIGGHPNNSALSGSGVTIAGGGGASAPNVAFGSSTTISGGSDNAARTFNSTVPGGARNCAGGAMSFAAGYRAKIRPGAVVGSGACAGAGASGLALGDSGTFVWADYTEQDFISSGSDQFLVRARGGMGVGTNAPQSQLHVHTSADAPGAGFEFNPTLLVENENAGDFFSQAIFARATGTIGIAVVAESEHPTGSTIGVSGSVSSPSGRAVQGTSPAGGHAGFFQGGRVYSQGSVGIGVVNPAFQLHLSQNSAAKPTSNAWTVSSDERLKTDIETLDGSLEKLLALRGVSYRWRDPASQGGHEGIYAGLLAQNVEQVFPEWVGIDSQGYKTVTVTGFEGLVAEALRELRDEKDQAIARLETENEALHARLASVETKHEQRLAELREAQGRQLADLRTELALLRELLAPAVAKGGQ